MLNPAILRGRVAEPTGTDELTRLIEVGAIADKGRLAEALTALCLAPDRRPGERELALFFEIIRGLVSDVEMPVRQKLSEGLASREDAPHDLIVMLANDVIEVAFPVLAESPLLDGDDLIALIHRRGSQHRLAITERRILDAAVSEAFVEAGDAPALEALLRNDGAAFRPETMSRLVDDSRHSEALQGSLLSRRDLPAALAHRMYDWVSDTLRVYISTAHPIPGLDGAVDAAVASTLRDDRFAVPEADEAAAAAAAAEEEEEDWNERPSPASLLRALELQDILRFEDMFQEIAGLDTATTTRALYDMGPEGLAIACRAAGLDRVTFGEIFCHLQGSRPYGAFRKSSVYVKGMAFFENTERGNAKRILEGWNRPADPIGI